MATVADVDRAIANIDRVLAAAGARRLQQAIQQKIERIGAVCPCCGSDVLCQVEAVAFDWSEGLPEAATVECDVCGAVIEFAVNWDIQLDTVQVVDVQDGPGPRYALACQLIGEIDGHLQSGTRHYYDTQGKRLIHLGEVVNAILSNTLQPTQKGEKDQ
jgi:hypothetical protein